MTRSSNSPVDSCNRVDLGAQILAYHQARMSPAGFAEFHSLGRWQHASHLDLLGAKLSEAFREGGRRIMVWMPPRHGKALSVDTPIFTTQGWRRHGDLKPGDWVFGPTGEPTQVHATTHAYNGEVYCVKFSSGGKIIAHKNHEWLIDTDRDCRRKACHGLGRGHRHQERLETHNIFGGYHRRRPMIHVAMSVRLPKNNLPIDPYLLGAWLGDGHSDMGYIFSGGEDVGHFSSLGEVSRDRDQYFRILVRGLKVKLRNLGVLNNKHVPDLYKYSSEEDRLALLQGLMDTDGHASNTGQCEFCSSSKALSSAVLEIVRSLGFKAGMCVGRATIDGKDFGQKFRVLFTPNKAIRVFRLERKYRRQVPTGSQANNHMVSSVEPYGYGLVNCIQVSGGVYLAGEELITTSNSELASAHTPCWILDQDPRARIMLCSYAATFAARWGRRNRNLAKSRAQFLRFEIARDSKAADEWETTEGGGMKTAGVGGDITGRGFDLGIIDDPCKNAASAWSEVIRDAQWNWWQSTFYTRAEPHASIVIVQTRWHQDDLSGRILAEATEPWEVICLPAIAEENDALGRKPGEPLWPARWPLEDLERIRAAVGEWVWSALYQQRPSLGEGSIWKRAWFRYWTEDPEDSDAIWLDGQRITKSTCRRFATVDLAMTEKETSDFTVVATWARWRDKLFLLDLIRRRMEAPEILATLEAVQERWHLDEMRVEAVQGQLYICQLLRAKGVHVREIKPDKEKRARYMASCLAWERGYVYHPRGAPWLATLEDELLSVPAATHDDQADVCAMAADEAFVPTSMSPPIIRPRKLLPGEPTSRLAVPIAFR